MDSGAQQRKLIQTAQKKLQWMTLEKIDPDKYVNRKIVGRGDLVSQVTNRVPIIGEQSQYGNPTVPEFHQQGPQ